ncbi:rCG61666 [Rattus norvegicus]|uniref:RCG61666 n=1 Tax=Rattus norvegicus TaxID=10116 RepID=A6HC60_RAT|nr:rCG61666 [Rattus norvegicus]
MFLRAAEKVPMGWPFKNLRSVIQETNQPVQF